jgi:hypothetical protein
VASDILAALTAQQLEQPGLLMQLDAHFNQQQQQQQQQSLAGSDRSYVLSVVAAVAAAAAGSMAGSRPAVLLRCARALVVFGVLPDTAWMQELAAALTQKMHLLAPGDCLAVVDAFGGWCSTRVLQQQQPQDAQEDEQLTADLQQLSAGLLLQLSRSPSSYSALQLCSAISSIALQLGFSVAAARAAAAPGAGTTQPQQLLLQRQKQRASTATAAAVQALPTLLQSLSHGQVLGAVPLPHVLALLRCLQAMQGGASGFGGQQLAESSFLAAAQRDGLQPRLRELKPHQFAELARSLAGLGLHMERELLDGYWQHLAEHEQLAALDGELAVWFSVAAGRLGLWCVCTTPSNHSCLTPPPLLHACACLPPRMRRPQLCCAAVRSGRAASEATRAGAGALPVVHEGSAERPVPPAAGGQPGGAGRPAADAG